MGRGGEDVLLAAPALLHLHSTTLSFPNPSTLRPLLMLLLLLTV